MLEEFQDMGITEASAYRSLVDCATDLRAIRDTLIPSGSYSDCRNLCVESSSSSEFDSLYRYRSLCVGSSSSSSSIQSIKHRIASLRRL